MLQQLQRHQTDKQSARHKHKHTQRERERERERERDYSRFDTCKLHVYFVCWREKAKPIIVNFAVTSHTSFISY